MTAAPSRLSFKIDLGPAEEYNTDAWVAAFHELVAEQRLDGLSIDVTDYRHVKNGPGVLLIGLEGDFGIETIDGCAGLKYTRKRALPNSLIDALLLVYRQLIEVCHVLRSDAPNSVHILDTHSRIELQFLDRLSYPGAPNENTQRLLRKIYSFFASIYGDSEVDVRLVGVDERRPLTIRVDANSPTLDALKRRLDALSDFQHSGANDPIV